MLCKELPASVCNQVFKRCAVWIQVEPPEESFRAFPPSAHVCPGISSIKPLQFPYKSLPYTSFTNHPSIRHSPITLKFVTHKSPFNSSLTNHPTIRRRTETLISSLSKQNPENSKVSIPNKSHYTAWAILASAIMGKTDGINVPSRSERQFCYR